MSYENICRNIIRLCHKVSKRPHPLKKKTLTVRFLFLFQSQQNHLYIFCTLSFPHTEQNWYKRNNALNTVRKTPHEKNLCYIFIHLICCEKQHCFNIQSVSHQQAEGQLKNPSDTKRESS